MLKPQKNTLFTIDMNYSIAQQNAELEALQDNSYALMGLSPAEMRGEEASSSVSAPQPDEQTDEAEDSQIE